MRGRALITGATAGIGNAFARELAGRGHDLVLVARDTERLESVAAGLREKHRVEVDVITADLTTDDGLRATVNALTDTARPVDLLVNNAGSSLAAWFGTTDIADEDHQLDLMVRAPMHLMDAAIKAMTGRGHGEIVNVASVAAFTPRGTYSAHKAWMVNALALGQLPVRRRRRHRDGAVPRIRAHRVPPAHGRRPEPERARGGCGSRPTRSSRPRSTTSTSARPSPSRPSRYKVLATIAQYAPKPLVARMARRGR